MADEVVYRLVLDGQDDNPAATSAAASRASKPAASDSFDPFELARKRIEREQQAEMADLAYKVITRNAPSMQQVQKDDEEEKRRQQDPYVIAAQLLERQRKADDTRLAAKALGAGTDIETERKKEAAEEAATQAEKDKLKAERDAEKARVEAARQQAQAEKDQRDKNMQDPVWLSQQALARDKLMEATRLQIAAAKQGVSPADIQNQEQREAMLKAGAGYVGQGSRFAASAMRGNIIGGGLDAVGSMGPVANVLAQSAQVLMSAVKQNAQDSRRLNQDLRPYSAALTRQSMMDDIKDIQFKMRLASEQGNERSRLESESRELDRREMRTGTLWQYMENFLRRAQVSMLESFQSGAAASGLAGGGMLSGVLREIQALNRRREIAIGDITRLPDRFNFVADPPRRGNRPGLSVPAIRAGGFVSPAIPGI